MPLAMYVPAAKIAGREAAELTFPLPSGDVQFSGRDYVFGFALPNFFFHLTAAYAILRMKGVSVGKLDYLGGLK